MTRKILVVDLPTLRLDRIESDMPRFAALARGWHRGPIDPVFPALTCPAQATLTTGASPREHGLVANAIFDRATRVPEFWVFHDDAIRARRVWEERREAGAKTGAFFLLNLNGAKTDAILLPKPIHHDDGTMSMWCLHKPDGLYPDLVKTMGHFNLLKFWGPMAGIDSSKWIAEAAKRAILSLDLDLSFVYLPHTDYAPQKFGPDSDAARKAHSELDPVLCGLIESLVERWSDLAVVVVSEYAITDVSRVVFPNRVLREAGLFAVREEDGRELADYANSPAFAMVDHQIAHVYCDPALAPRVRDLFADRPGIEVATTDAASIGLDNPRSGEVVLVARRDAWFAYPWWEGLDRAPKFATTIDIHAKPGYDPLEMFWDPKINGISQDVSLIRGSHGAFPRDPDQKAAVVSNLPGVENAGSTADVWRAIRGG